MTSTDNTLDHPMVAITGGRVEILDEAGDITRWLYPDEAIELADALNARREAIEAIAASKSYAEKVARVLSTVTHHFGVPLSLTVKWDGEGDVTLREDNADALLSWADEVAEPVMATYDGSSAAKYASLVGRVHLHVVCDGVTYSAVVRDLSLANIIDGVPFTETVSA